MSSERKKPISIILPTLRGGGAERLHVNLAKLWKSQGYGVTFALMNRTGELLGSLPDGVAVKNLSASRIRDSLLPLIRYFRAAKPEVTMAAITKCIV